MANFDDLQGAVAQFGTNNKVIFDDTGMPSIMVAVPKAKYSGKEGAEHLLPGPPTPGAMFRSRGSDRDVRKRSPR